VIRRPGLHALLALLQQPRHDPHDDLVRRVVRLRARDVCEYCLRRSVDLPQVSLHRLLSRARVHIPAHAP
jgi:hypothetical protein